MSTVHVYTAEVQPLTSFVDHTFDPPMHCENAPRSPGRCEHCGRRRWASKLSVQCFYDGRRVFCTGRDECRAARKRKRRGPKRGGKA